LVYISFVLCSLSDFVYDVMMFEANKVKIALVHDELTRRGGAEGVLEEMIRIFPQADIYALYTGHPRITVDERKYDVRTSFLQKWPSWFRQHPRRLLPFLAQAAEQFDLSNYDVVISSASAFAKGIITRANVPHISYCHTPTRYLWDTTHEATRSVRRGMRPLAEILMHQLRLVDFAAAQRVDFFLANSDWTKQRIWQTYHRESERLYPPVDTIFFRPDLNGTNRYNSFFMCVGRLTVSKKFDQAIEVCEKLGFGLVVVGKGEAEKRLRQVAGKHTRFVGNVSPEELRKLYRRARALIQPGEEDFGIAAVEAQACGCPVIAYGSGGARETVLDGSSGWFYNQQTPEALAEAVRLFIEHEREFTSEAMQRQALLFSKNNFKQGLLKVVEKALV
jgi:glycosyltransferase involved in cell wall biosynthesis